MTVGASTSVARVVSTLSVKPVEPSDEKFMLSTTDTVLEFELDDELELDELASEELLTSLELDESLELEELESEELLTSLELEEFDEDELELLELPARPIFPTPALEITMEGTSAAASIATA